MNLITNINYSVCMRRRFIFYTWKNKGKVMFYPLIINSVHNVWQKNYKFIIITKFLFIRYSFTYVSKLEVQTYNCILINVLVSYQYISKLYYTTSIIKKKKKCSLREFVLFFIWYYKINSLIVVSLNYFYYILLY